MTTDKAEYNRVFHQIQHEYKETMMVATKTRDDLIEIANMEHRRTQSKALTVLHNKIDTARYVHLGEF